MVEFFVVVLDMLLVDVLIVRFVVFIFEEVKN